MRHASIEVLSSYLDGELAGRRRRRLERHLQHCEQCLHRLDGLHDLVRRLEGMERISPAPFLERQVLQRVQAQERRESLMDRLEKAASRVHVERWVWMPTFGMVVALVSIIYLFSWGLHRQQQSLPAALDVEAPAAESTAEVNASTPGRTSPSEIDEIAVATQSEREVVDLAESASPILDSRARTSSVPSEELRLAEASEPGSVSRAVEIDKRTFELRDGLWIERGLDPSEPPTSSLDPAELSAPRWRERLPSISELERLGGPVRLRVGDRVIQIDFDR